MANRFDKPIIQTTKIDNNKIANLFSIAGNMDSFEIKNFSLMQKIPLSVQDPNGNNLIHMTILDNGNNCELVRLEFIKFLYSENVNPDAPNKDNITPLLYACSKQFTTIVKYLINIGVDVNYADNFSNNAYHYLFGSMIKDYNQVIPKSLFPKYKEIDDDKLQFIKDIKKNIFNLVLKKDNIIAPELQNILNTIRLSIGNNVDAKNIVIEFQTEYNKLLNDTKTQSTFKVNDLFSTMLNKFINLIQRNWKSFPKSNNIELHPSDINSYPLGDESGLSIIRNSDYKEYIKRECDRIINKLNTDVINDNKIVDLIDLDSVNNQLLTNFVQNVIRDNFTMASLVDHKKEYNMDRFIHNNCIDNADNIIDYKHNTFAGGSRQVEIIDEFTIVQIKTLFVKNTKKEVIGALAYSLVVDYAQSYNFNGDFVLNGGNTLEDTIVEYIYSITTNENIIQIQSKLQNFLNRNPNYTYLLELIGKRERFNPGHFIYVFCCAYKGIERINDATKDNSNLKVELRQGIVLLCSAVYHNKGDILKSLYNVFKPLLIEDIKPNSPDINSTYSNLIKLLLTDGNITKDDLDTTDNLDRIVLLTDEYFQGSTVTLNDNNREYLGLSLKDVEGMIDSEKLGFYIVKYYNNMRDKPLLQNIVDILVLIRLFEINKTREPQLNNLHFINRLKTLYLTPTAFADIDNIQTNSNMDNTELTDANIDRYFKTLFNTIDNQKIYEQISQYQIPSRINYFLYGDYEYLNKPLDNERRLYLLKQIEANHFGLNFIGLIPSLDFVQNVDNPAGGGGNFNTELNLFNYNRINNPGPDYILFHPLNEYLNRPPTYLAYFNLLQKFSNNVNELQNRILRRLREMFELLKNGNISLYSKAIGYYYPILNVLESQERFFNQVQNNTNYSDNNIPNIRNIVNANYISDNYFPLNTFNINYFNSGVNRLNGMLFLYYYLNNNRDDNIVRIPKFLYHQLGNKPIVIFDNKDKNIDYPTNNTIQDGDNTLTVTDEYDKHTLGRGYSDIDYNNIISNIQNRRFFLSRDIIANDFVMSKNSKLPPSLISVYDEFLKFTINSLARKAIDTDITIDDTFLDVIPNLGKVTDLQKNLLKAKYTEELILDYLRNNVYTIGYELFTNLIGVKQEIKQNVEQIFGELDFNVILDKEPSLEIVDKITKDEKDIIKNYYNFSDNSIEKVIKSVNQQFKLYPNNYNSIRLNKKFYRTEIKKEIVKLLFENNCNIFTSNNEGQISIINLLKYYKIDILAMLKDDIDYDIFNTDNILSPQRFTYNEYIMNIEKFISHGDSEDNKYALQLDNFTQNQYMDVFYNIIGNEKLGFNIINNLKTSFALCNYITQQFLSEKMYDFNSNFKYNDLNNILTMVHKKNIDFKNLYFNTILESLNIYNNNNDIVIEDIIRRTDGKITKLTEEIQILKDKKEEMKNISGINLNVDGEITNKEGLLTNYIEYIDKLKILNRIEDYRSKTFIVDDIKLNVIDRYNNILLQLDDERLVFMEGFKKILNEKKLDNSNENIIQHLLNYEYESKNDINIINKETIGKLSKFYSHLSGYCEVYFHNEYIEHNNIKQFVKDLLVFLTQNIICVGIETLVRKVLFEYFSLTEFSDMNINKEKVNLILDKSYFKDNNYKILAEKIVMNNTNVFMNEFEENEFMSESASDLINNLLDNLIKTSPLKLDDKVKEQLKNITPYFETIVPKTINNWRVVIENQFLFVINHGRILNCMNIVGLPN